MQLTTYCSRFSVVKQHLLLVKMFFSLEKERSTAQDVHGAKLEFANCTSMLILSSRVSPQITFLTEVIKLYPGYFFNIVSSF
jgi:hypothetical protein